MEPEEPQRTTARRASDVVASVPSSSSLSCLLCLSASSAASLYSNSPQTTMTGRKKRKRTTTRRRRRQWWRRWRSSSAWHVFPLAAYNLWQRQPMNRHCPKRRSRVMRPLLWCRGLVGETLVVSDPSRVEQLKEDMSNKSHCSRPTMSWNLIKASSRQLSYANQFYFHDE